jgi:hypothetical protein
MFAGTTVSANGYILSGMQMVVDMGISAVIATALWLCVPVASAASETPEVVCITQLTEPSAPAQAEYSRRPHFCALHQRGKLPVDGLDTYGVGRMRWSAWRADAAIGVGELAIPSVGTVPARVRLFASTTACSPSVLVFTKARIRYALPHGHGKSFTIPLDRCLS